MEFLRFIFSSFWVWAGFLVLVAVVLSGAAELVKACKRNRKITAYRIGERYHVTVENATRKDAAEAVRRRIQHGTGVFCPVCAKPVYFQRPPIIKKA